MVVVMLATVSACGAAPTATPLPTPTPAPTATPVPAPSAASMAEKVKNTVSSMPMTYSGAVLVGRDGAVVFSGAFGMADREQQIANTTTTRFRLAEVTMSFTAAAILMLQAQGKLNVQDHICMYIQPCPDAWKDITIHHLLTHTSGTKDIVDSPDFMTIWQSPQTPESLLAFYETMPQASAPGAAFIFNRGGYDALGYIIEKVSGKSYEAFLKDSIFQPLGMADTGYLHAGDPLALGYNFPSDTAPIPDAIAGDPSMPYAAGGLYSTVEDLWRWSQALESDQILPKTLRDQMFTRYVAVSDAGIPSATGYCYGFFDGAAGGAHVIFSSAISIHGFGAALYRLPDQHMAIITLSNTTGAASGVADKLAKALTQ
jgi:CubicO group peptidase (beta-lactamase class C family)